MTSRRDVIKAGAMAAIAATVQSSVTLADPLPEQHKVAAGHLLARQSSHGHLRLNADGGRRTAE